MSDKDGSSSHNSGLSDNEKPSERAGDRKEDV